MILLHLCVVLTPLNCRLMQRVEDIFQDLLFFKFSVHSYLIFLGLLQVTQTHSNANERLSCEKKRNIFDYQTESIVHILLVRSENNRQGKQWNPRFFCTHFLKCIVRRAPRLASPVTLCNGTNGSVGRPPRRFYSCSIVHRNPS